MPGGILRQVGAISAQLAPEAADAPHGSAFEAVLRRLVPDWRERRRELSMFRGE